MLTASPQLDSYDRQVFSQEWPVSPHTLQNSSDEPGFDDEEEVIEEETITPVEEFDDEDFDDDFDDDFEEDAEELEDEDPDAVEELDDDAEVDEELEDDDF